MSETINNIIRFNYLTDPTTLMGNSWITNNTDTTQNTVAPVGEQVTKNWRTITILYNSRPESTFIIKVRVNEENEPYLYDFFTEVGSDSSLTGIQSKTSKNITYYTFRFENDATVNIQKDDFTSAVEGQTYEYDNGSWSYTSSTSMGYDLYNVELYINSDVTVFPNNLFTSDNNITSIEFDTYSITSIEDSEGKGSGAFGGCEYLTSVILHSNLTYIGSSAFNPTSNLETFTIYSTTPPEIVISTFSSIPDTTILYVPENSIETYSTSDWGTYFTNIQAAPVPPEPPVPPTPTKSYGFNLSGMKNVDYGKQGVIILRN